MCKLRKTDRLLHGLEHGLVLIIHGRVLTIVLRQYVTRPDAYSYRGMSVAVYLTRLFKHLEHRRVCGLRTLLVILGT